MLVKNIIDLLPAFFNTNNIMNLRQAGFKFMFELMQQFPARDILSSYITESFNKTLMATD
jgi:hypothetical protein